MFPTLKYRAEIYLQIDKSSLKRDFLGFFFHQGNDVTEIGHHALNAHPSVAMNELKFILN